MLVVVTRKLCVAVSSLSWPLWLRWHSHVGALRATSTGLLFSFPVPVCWGKHFVIPVSTENFPRKIAAMQTREIACACSGRAGGEGGFIPPSRVVTSSTEVPVPFRELQWAEKQIPSVPRILVSVVWLCFASGVTGGDALSPGQSCCSWWGFCGGFEGLSSPRALGTARTGGDSAGPQLDSLQEPFGCSPMTADLCKPHLC